MKISLDWLKQYVKVDINSAEMAAHLTRIGLEVENIESFETIRGSLKGLVIGNVLTCAKHPDADKLQVTTVDVGNDDPKQIVCGAPNVAAGQKVVVALPGVTLFPFNGEPFEIKKAKIRGQASEGMICAEDEIGLGEVHDGIMELDPDLKVGSPASEIFNPYQDEVLEIGLTPNRVDAASHYGVARDLAAVLNTKAQLPNLANFIHDNEDFPIEIEIRNTEKCPRYTGLTISGLEVKESPLWLQNKLKAIGLNPINNVVDITNFVLHETGQPLHAFDAQGIKGNKVIIQTLPDETPFVTLDEKERKLSENDLMICNESEPMCIAGVFGGMHSGVTNNTHHIFLESAYFSPDTIRKSEKKHGLNTDASFRFSRGADIEMAPYALKRAALLIREIAGGQISSKLIDVYPNPIISEPIELRYSKLNKICGAEIPREFTIQVLGNLEFEILSQSDDSIMLKTPFYRIDVKREIDVIEEVLRIYGFENIPLPDKVNASPKVNNWPDNEKINSTVSTLLANTGFHEVSCNSLVSTSWAHLEAPENYSLVPVLHPMSEEHNVLRPDLLLSGLNALAYNLNNKQNAPKIFEFGFGYLLDNDAKYVETEYLSLFLCGLENTPNWHSKSKNEVDFFVLKGTVERILKRLKISDLKQKALTCAQYSFSSTYFNADSEIVRFGKLSPKLLKDSFDIRKAVYFASFNWDKVRQLLKPRYYDVPEINRFPIVKRDLAMIVKKNTPFSQIQDICFKVGKKLLKDLQLFDVYEDTTLGDDKKSLAISLTLQDSNKTLTEKEIDGVISKLIYNFEKELGATIRK